MISTKGRYALRVMLDLAMQDPERYIPLKEIASRQELSEKYLEIILKTLVKQTITGYAWKRRRISADTRTERLYRWRDSHAYRR